MYRNPYSLYLRNRWEMSLEKGKKQMFYQESVKPE